MITLIGCKNEFPGLHPASRQSFVYKTHILDDRVNVDKQTYLLTVCGFYDLLNEQVVKFWASTECFNIQGRTC